MASALFSGIPFHAQSGDQLVSKVVGAAIAALFKRSDKIEAVVRAEPVAKLLQGSIDGFDLLAQGLQMYNGMRIEGMELFSEAVSIDFSEIFQGKVKLRQPTQSSMRVVLTEGDLSLSFNTPFILEKLRRLEVNGRPLEIRQIQIQINNEGTLRIQAEVNAGEEWLPIDFTSQVDLQERRRIQFVNVKHQGIEEAVAISQSLVNHVNELLDLDKFALDGTQLRVDRVRVRDHKIVFYGTALIDRFPRRKAAAA
ncbi:MAG: DUF2993 domain-containing protein [Synechococcaceae cyanobacterium SM2_3_1]|nr:DUF2993 domain-containing protein [Synechococcaceae cyanobacterium SM2_3_1]